MPTAPKPPSAIAADTGKPDRAPGRKATAAPRRERLPDTRRSMNPRPR